MGRNMTMSLLTLPILLACVAVNSSCAEDKYALLVGVTTYRHSRMNDVSLDYPEADAGAVGDLLEKSGYKVVKLLGREATKAAVARELTELSEQGTSEGVVVVGLFGHGVQYGDDAFFGPWDTKVRIVKDAQGRTVRDQNGQPKLEPDPDSMTSMREILDALATCGAGNRVLLADCCREDPSAARGRAFGSKLRVADLPPGTAALFACSANERAFEHEEWGHGAFTQSFLEHCTRAGSELTANALSADLYRDVRKKVRDKTNGKERQTVNPVINGIVELKLKPLGPVTAFTNAVGQQLKLIPAGEFMMGSRKSADNVLKEFPGEYRPYHENQHPRHKVRITRPFYVSAHEVTIGQFRQFVEAEGYLTDVERGKARDNPLPVGTSEEAISWERSGHLNVTDNHPVTVVTWNDAQAFCSWLSRLENRTVRLPTQAEWEYACRAGTTTQFWTGDDPETLAAGANVPNAQQLSVVELPAATADGQALSLSMARTVKQLTFVTDSNGNLTCEVEEADSATQTIDVRNRSDVPEVTVKAASGVLTIPNGESRVARPYIEAPRPGVVFETYRKDLETGELGWINTSSTLERRTTSIGFLFRDGTWSFGTLPFDLAADRNTDFVSVRNYSRSATLHVRVGTQRFQIAAGTEKRFRGISEGQSHVINTDDGYEGLAPVGRLRPNAFGLFDMHGNVWEWCEDGYDELVYSSAIAVDSRGPRQAKRYALRGACYL